MTRQNSKILLAFADSTLGGCARNSLTSARVWRTLDIDVQFLPLLGVHPERRQQFSDVADFAEHPDEINWHDIRAVHLNHSSWSREQLNGVSILLNAAIKEGASAPLISTNIFGVRDMPLERWPNRRTVCVKGHWAAAQYTYAMCDRLPRHRPWIFPGPQNDEFFRPPTDAERQAARNSLGLGAAPAILRTGSALMPKWSTEYLALAESAACQGIELLLVGVPRELQVLLRNFSNVKTFGVTGDEQLLRNFYWAADAFAINASRGESFGNVLPEAMLCGLPAIYRGRPYRDNSPWEFQGLPLFTYTDSCNSWVRASIHGARTNSSIDPQLRIQSYNATRARYGIKSIAPKLEAILHAVENSTDPALFVSAPVLERRPIGHRNSMKCFLTHNPLAAYAKQQKLAFQSR